MKAIETRYKGYRFRSRLEARWAVFFDAMGIQWWYEYEGFELSFDVDQFDPEEDLLQGAERRTFQETLEFAEGWYLPDFYLPELNYWIEIKSMEPSMEEREKALLLVSALHTAGKENLDKVFLKAEVFPERYEKSSAIDQAFGRLMRLGGYIIYGDIPWPYPQKGNAIGYGAGGELGAYRHALGDEVEHEQDEYWGFYNLCWHQCRLCSKIGMGIFGEPYCRRCRYELERLIYKLSKGEELAKQEETGWEFRELKEDIQQTEKPRLLSQVLNLEFFRNAHRTEDLQRAYTAARSARFEERRRRHLR